MMTDAGSSLSQRDSLPSLKGLCQAAALIFPCLLALPNEALAQRPGDLQHLLFEAVAIEMDSQPLEEGRTPLFRELTTLPRGESAHELQDWLYREYEAARLAEAELEQRIESYQARITELERAYGPYEPSLGENLLALGSAFQQQGDHQQAIELFQRAWHINRVNGGLFNLEQESIVKKLIHSHLATGNLQRADEQHEYLFFIQQKTHGPGSPDLLPALTELAEWNIYAYNLQAGVPLPGLPYEAFSFTAPPMDSEGRENFLTRHLLNAQTLYRAIIQILLNSAGVADPRLLDAEKRLALTNYFFAKNYAMVNTGAHQFDGSFTLAAAMAGVNVGATPISALGYRHGREALERRVDYLRGLESADPLQTAAALVDLGDWQLLFNKRVTALDTYEEAWELLTEAGQSPGELLNPPVPVALPTFILGNHSRAAQNIPEELPLAYKGHIDLRLHLNSWGIPQNVEILAYSGSASEEIRERLLRFVKRMQYRPRFQDGAAVNNDESLLRYYFTY